MDRHYCGYVKGEDLFDGIEDLYVDFFVCENGPCTHILVPREYMDSRIKELENYKTNVNKEHLEILKKRIEGLQRDIFFDLAYS